MDILILGALLGIGLLLGLRELQDRWTYPHRWTCPRCDTTIRSSDKEVFNRLVRNHAHEITPSDPTLF